MSAAGGASGLLTRPALVLVLALLAAQAAAQEARPPAPEFAAPFLPDDHWSLGAVRRLYGLGLTPTGFDPGRRTLSRKEAGAVLLRAAELAEADTAVPGARLARAYARRFAEEFPATASALEGRPARTAWFGRAGVLAGVEVRRGAVRAGSGYDNGGGWTGPEPAADMAGGVLGASAAVALHPHLAAVVAPVLRGGGLELADAHLVAVVGGVGAWAGRRPVGFGPGVGGALVLDAIVPFDGGGLFLARPLELPGPFGSLRVETFVSRMERNGPVMRPWVWAARAGLSPHPRLSLGVNRGAVFAGNGEFSLRDLAYVIVGKHGGAHSETDNQVVALDAFFRPPLGRVPLLLYVEWGFEDSAGAWKDVPALVAGIELGAVPGIEALALGLERTAFAGSCCGNPIWYRHWAFQQGWTDGGVPLGHPLGGHGSEWLLHSRADLLDARLRLAGRVFRRRRGAENLFAPDRQGNSRGASLHGEYRISGGWDGVARAFYEWGERGWHEAHVLAGLRARF